MYGIATHRCLHTGKYLLVYIFKLKSAFVFSRWLCFVAKRYTLQQRCIKKWIGTALLGTRRYNFQPPTPTLSATGHNIADRQTDRRSDGHTDGQTDRHTTVSWYNAISDPHRWCWNSTTIRADFLLILPAIVSSNPIQYSFNEKLTERNLTIKMVNVQI